MLLMGSWLKRREVWVPTLRGWLALLVISAAIAGLSISQVHDFLAQQRPAPKAELLVVEGWLTEEALDEAAEIFLTGSYSMLVTTGGPIEAWARLYGHETFADRAADYLVQHGLPASKVHAVSAPASARNRTFLAAVMLREWLEDGDIKYESIDVLSSGVHARRSRWMFQAALGPEVKVGVRAAAPTSYDAQVWWRSSDGAKTVLGEAISLAWTACCFRRPEPGSSKELRDPMETR
jgi:uncharacterized SAM-binding protein YcdF (DUF218 family)